MKETNKTPKRWISIRVKPEQYTIIYQHFQSTTCRKLSEYVRRVLLNKPVTINHRNQSADEILSALSQVRKELSAIGNNFNQAVHRLHTLDNVPEIKVWAVLNEKSKQTLLSKIEDIRVKMNQIYELWLHK